MVYQEYTQRTTPKAKKRRSPNNTQSEKHYKLKSCKHCKNPEFKNIISFDFGSGSREDGIKDVYNKMQEIIKEEDNQ